MEQVGAEGDDAYVSPRLREAEKNLQTVKKEVSTYQDMIQQSQQQFNQLEKKYSKVR